MKKVMIVLGLILFITAVDASFRSTEDSCLDTSINCIYNVFQCNSSSVIREKCRKTCGLCVVTRDPTTPEPCFGFHCMNGECINENYQCNGIKDCSDNSDEIESNCSPLTVPPAPLAPLELDTDGWTPSLTACIIGHNNRIAQLVPNLEYCKDECQVQNSKGGFICRSIEYNSFTQQCSLSEESRYTTKHFEEPCSIPGWIYTERFIYSVVASAPALPAAPAKQG